MSQAPHCANMRNGYKMGNYEMIDTMIKDGLWDAFNGYHMGNTAENVAEQWQITRDVQDEFAVASQNKQKPRRRPASSRMKSRGHDQDAQGRHRGRGRRIHPPRRDA